MFKLIILFVSIMVILLTGCVPVTLTDDFPVPWGRRLVRFFFWEILRDMRRQGAI